MEVVRKPPKPAPEKVMLDWAKEWHKEGEKVDWQKFIPPRGYVALPRRWVVERTFSRMVVLTLWDNLRYVQAISRMAVDALMHKSSSSEELLATLGAVTRGSSAGGNAVISMPRGLLQRLGDEPAGALTERELEVLVLAARGLSNRFIARELSLSEATIKRHLANIYEKVDVRSRNEAVRVALVAQWIGLHEITSAHTDGHDGSSDGQAR